MGKKYETWYIDTLRYMQFNIKLWPKSIKAEKFFKMADQSSVLYMKNCE